MKNKLKYLILSAASLLVFASCEESIDVKPVDVLAPDVALAKIATHEQLINSAYDRMQSFQYLAQYMMLAPDALADNAILVNNTGRYVGELVNQDNAHFNIWFLYPAINDINIILDKIDTSTVLTTANRARVASVVAQARFLRGLIYFDLMRAYAYEPGQEVDGWNKGVILRDSPVFDVAQADKRPRATNVEVYEFIENDLRVALDTMAKPFVAIANQPFRANRAAAHALMSRLYLYWDKNDLASQYADSAIATKPAAVNLVSAANYAGMWNTAQTVGRTESLFELRISPGNGANQDWSSVDGVNESLHSLTTFGITASSQFVLAGADELMEQFEATDARKNVWTKVTVRGQEYNMCLKWSGSAGAGLWADNIPVIRMSEVYLTKAEALYKLGDEAGARTWLSTFRAARALPAIAGGVTGNALFEAIMKERRLEFAFEGARWFDLKRNGLNVPKLDGDPVLSTDYKILAPIPPNQVILNSILEQNPGY